MWPFLQSSSLFKKTIMPITRHSSPSAPLMVDIPFFGKATGTERFLFNGGGKQSLAIWIKKFFWEKEMCQAAKERVVALCSDSNFIEFSTVRRLLSHINESEYGRPSEVDAAEVIEAFASVVRDQEFTRAYVGIADNTEHVAHCAAKIPEELKAEIVNPERVISPQKLIDDIKLILSNKNSREISGLRGKTGFDALEMHVKKTGELKTPEAYSALLDLLSAAKMVMGDPDTPYLKILCSNINALYTEIGIIYEDLVQLASENQHEALSVALQQEMPFFRMNHHNLGVLQSFLAFVADPELDLEQPQVRQNLNLFVNEFAGSVHQLKSTTRDLCLGAVDKLEGRLLVKQNTYLPSPSEVGLRGELLPLLTALQSVSRKYGPSGSWFNLFQYAQNKEAAINKASYWSLSRLTEEHVASLRDSLPTDKAKNTLSKILSNLRYDLGRFKKILDDKDSADKRIGISAQMTDTKNAGQAEKSGIQKKTRASKLKRITGILSRANILPTQADARNKIIVAVRYYLSELPVFKDNLHTRAELQAFFDFMENHHADFDDDETRHHLNAFILSFFAEIGALHVDARMLCLAEVDKLLGLKLAYEKADFFSVSVEKIKGRRIAGLIATLKAKSEEIGPTGSLTHLCQYVEKGDAAINLVSFWTLVHLSKFQKSMMMDFLTPAQKDDFSELMVRLESDLKNFRQNNLRMM